MVIGGETFVCQWLSAGQYQIKEMGRREKYWFVQGSLGDLRRNFATGGMTQNHFRRTWNSKQPAQSGQTISSGKVHHATTLVLRTALSEYGIVADPHKRSSAPD